MIQPSRKAQRANGTICVEVMGPENRIKKFFQQGSSRFIFPKYFKRIKEGIVINTAGGVTGGDRFTFRIKSSHDCSLILSTQAAEKAYEASDNKAVLENSFKVENGSKIYWLPQELILFSKSAVSRNTKIEVDNSSEFLAFDHVILGRKAMGEVLSVSNFIDRWKIYYDNRLVYFDQFGWKKEVPRGISGFKNISSFASFFYVGRKAEYYLEKLRAYTTSSIKVFAGSSLRNNCLITRVHSRDISAVREETKKLLGSIWNLEEPEVWRV